MDFRSSNIYDNIIDYLSNSLSKDDKESVEQWIKESKDNEFTFNSIKSIWEGNYETENIVDDKWKDFDTQLKVRKPLKQKYIYVVAAVLLLMLSFTWVVQSYKNDVSVMQTNNDSFLSDTLANGWVVYLYPNSVLSTYKSFKDYKETLGYRFSGEGFFVVPEHEGADIVINVGGANIQVGGAAFRINSCSENNDFSVLVESGKLDLESVKMPENKLLINAGEQGYYSCSQKTIWKNTKNEDIYLIYQPEVVDL